MALLGANTPRAAATRLRAIVTTAARARSYQLGPPVPLLARRPQAAVYSRYEAMERCQVRPVLPPPDLAPRATRDAGGPLLPVDAAAGGETVTTPVPRRRSTEAPIGAAINGTGTRRALRGDEPVHGHRRPPQATATVASVPVRAIGAHRRPLLLAVQTPYEGTGPLTPRRLLDGQGTVARAAPLRPIRSAGTVRVAGVLRRVPGAPLHAAVVGEPRRGAACGLGVTRTG